MLGFVFPGQGSQFVGMGKAFYDQFPIVQQTFQEGSDALSIDFKKLLFEGPDSELKLTHNTQPAILLLSVALGRLTKDFWNNEPNKICAGHSLGEYSALVANGVLKFNEALKAVRIRGELMQKAVPVGKGNMLAVLGVENNAVIKICKWVEQESGLKPLEPANFNAPGQVVISGNAAAVEWLTKNFKGSALSAEIRAKFIPLNVSAPFHCSMMMPAQKEMQPVLQKMQWSQTHFPIIQNVTAQETTNLDDIQKNLINQISSPVKWVQSVIRMRDMGVKRIIEIGPGKVLTNLIKKIDSSGLTTFNIESIDDFNNLEREFKT